MKILSVLILFSILLGCGNENDIPPHRDRVAKVMPSPCPIDSNVVIDSIGLVERFDIVHCYDTLYLKLDPSKPHYRIDGAVTLSTKRIDDGIYSLKMLAQRYTIQRMMVLHESALPQISLFIESKRLGYGYYEERPEHGYAAELQQGSIREIFSYAYRDVYDEDTVVTPIIFDSALGLYRTGMTYYDKVNQRVGDEVRTRTIGETLPVLELHRSTYFCWEGDWYEVYLDRRSTLMCQPVSWNDSDNLGLHDAKSDETR